MTEPVRLLSGRELLLGEPLYLALVFVVFDIEAVLLFPVAVAFNALSWFAVLNVIIFILILLAALVFAWRKGALEWE